MNEELKYVLEAIRNLGKKAGIYYHMENLEELKYVLAAIESITKHAEELAGMKNHYQQKVRRRKLMNEELKDVLVTIRSLTKHAKINYNKGNLKDDPLNLEPIWKEIFNQVRIGNNILAEEEEG